MTTDYNSLIMGSSARAAKFANPGDRVWGTIMGAKVRQQTDLDNKLKFFDSGDPMMEVLITILTEGDPEDDDDDMMRTIYAHGQMLQAIRQAAIKGGSPRGIADGGQLIIQFMSVDQPTKKGFNGAKRFFAKYAPPAQMTALPDEEANVPIDPDDLPF